MYVLSNSTDQQGCVGTQLRIGEKKTKLVEKKNKPAKFELTIGIAEFGGVISK